MQQSSMDLVNTIPRVLRPSYRLFNASTMLHIQCLYIYIQIYLYCIAPAPLNATRRVSAFVFNAYHDP